MVAADRYRRGGNRAKRVNAALAQPLVVVTEWGARGALLLGMLFLGVMAAAAPYWIAVRNAQRLSIAGLTALVGGALLVAWCVPVLFSSDVYAYAAYGELARLGLDPYVRSLNPGDDALIRDAIWQWNPGAPPGTGSFPICVYGPAFVLLAKALVSALAPLGTLAQLQGLRAVGSAAFIACVPLAYAAFGGERSVRLCAAATIGLNPVALWCAAEGHNDALVLAIVLAGFALARHRLVTLGAAIAGCSALVKLPGAAAAIGFAVADRRARVGAMAGIAISAAFSIPLLRGVTTQLAPHGRYAPQASLQALLGPLGPLPAWTLAGAVAIALAARAVVLLRARNGEGWVWLGLGAWVLVPNPYPWYGLWLVALAATAPRSRAAGVAIGLSFTSLLRYVPDAVAIPGPALAAVLGALASLPLLWLSGIFPSIMSHSNDG